ncbi:hypothetical protein GF326_12625 [Candidatus Bathyarchaeota archaeon]|nr:hypothetical protein [Candidatus Bathyarchaeota archaeon]
MQKVGTEMHFSEHTFITDSGLDEKVFKTRIFTRRASFPSLETCGRWLRSVYRFFM